MINLITHSYFDCTLGRLFYEDFQCFTLELPWLDNQKNISCIPEGTYEYFKRISPSRGREIIQLKDVPGGRTYIQLHPGNYTKQILGCILPGDSIKFLDGDSIPDVTNSGNTFEKLINLVPDEGTIQIHRST